MHRNFATVVGPLLETLDPTVIAVVQKPDGPLASRLTASTSGRVHVIDPGEPEGLRTLEPVDLLLVDGEPSWQSTFANLSAATEIARTASTLPPVILVHNVHWPYGRRDAAPAEHAARTGVLTAVEDFTHQDTDRWQIADVPGFGGTALLVTHERLAEEPALRALIDVLSDAETLRRVARRIDRARGEAEAGAEAPAEIEALRAERDKVVAELQRVSAAEAQSAASLEAAAEAERAAAELSRRVGALEAEVRDLLEHRARHEAALWRIGLLEKDLTQRDAERREAIAARDHHARAASDALAKLGGAHDELTRHRAELDAARTALATEQESGAERERRLRELAESERLLSGRILHLEDMTQSARAEAADAAAGRSAAQAAWQLAQVDLAEAALALRGIRSGRRSRLAHLLRRARRRISFRPVAPSALERALNATEQSRQLPAIPVNHGYAGADVPAFNEGD